MDGFPLSRDHWATMTDQNLLPDSVLVLSDENAPPNYLLGRFTQQKGLPDPSTFKSKNDAGADDEVGSMCVLFTYYMWAWLPAGIINSYTLSDICSSCNSSTRGCW